MRSTSPELARSVLDAAPDAMLIMDDSGTILFVNHQMSAIFGYEHDELVGSTIETLIPERFRGRHLAHREKYLANRRIRPMGVGLDLYALRKNGSEFPVEISLSPINAEQQVLIAAAIRDVTARNQARAELIAARETAELATRSKSRFLATASHDLRQPLQALALLTGALGRMVQDPEALEAVHQQEFAIGAMSRLLNALLDISKLESGAIKPDKRDFAAARLFDELRLEFESVAARKGLSLTTENSAATLHGDASLIEQILRNLLSNAFKYTESGRVTLRCRELDQQRARIEVIDTGIGISAEQLPHIYEEFYQIGVPANSTRQGYGLGLSIVQRLVKLMELTLEVSSTPGRGSTFALLLPLSSSKAKEAAAPQNPQRSSTAAVGRTHILLVEDDQGVREATRMLLKVSGYHVTAVSSRKEALAIAQQTPPVDVILTDYHLAHGESGTQVIASLRELLGRPVKAILMTGDTSSAVRELPTNDHVRLASKPIKADELLTLLKELIAGQSAR